MNGYSLTKPKLAYHHLKHPGGRLTKIGGQAVSLAPQLGQAAVSLATSVSRIALGATLALAASSSAGLASCDELPPGVWTCSGSLTTTQDITALAGLGLDVSTTPGFGITTATGLAFNLLTNAGDLGLTFSDAYGSTITGAVRGINARHLGTGALSITTTGAVEGVDNSGIYAVGYGSTTGLTISTAEVSGRTHGIVANNSGGGATSVTATGDVTGTLSEGILAAGSGTDLTVSADTVTGGTHGIYARNVGSGELSVTTTGTVTGNGVTGIFANNSFGGTNQTISTAAVTGDTDGIYAANGGSGAISITATGDVTGTRGRGIVARNTATAMSDVTIYAAGVTGYTYGIHAQNYGTAALSITATGEVRATRSNGTGILAVNEAASTSLTINADAVSGGNYGINAFNSGSGALSITTTGAVLGTNLAGILAYNRAGDGLTINSAEVTGRVYGIGATHYGSGELSVTSTGAVRATHGDGIFAVGHGSDLTVSATEVSGMHSGIRAYSFGSGELSVTATGDVRGDNYYGIAAYSDTSGTDLTIYAAAVSGGNRGIDATHNGSGALSITATGHVSTPSRAAISAFNHNGTDITISATSIYGGSRAVHAHNYGSGALSITTTGDAIAGSHAIVARNRGTNLTIETALVSGGYNGIEARNYGTGALSITSTGAVTGESNFGILGTNSNYGTDLTISAAAVSGNGFGIDARNSGTGALSITTTGDVNSTASDGIYATNFFDSTDLTISTAGVTGYNDGISAFSSGSGAFSITTTGEVTGTNRYGIFATNRYGTGMAVSSAAVTGGTVGIFARNHGSGSLTVTATGDVTGISHDGLSAFNDYLGADLSVYADTVAGHNYGIAAHNLGVGALSITAAGEVTGTTRDGIHANNRATATDLSVSAALVTGYDTGIEARNSGTGVLSITSTGLVTGQNGAGILGTNSSYGTDLTISAAAVSANGLGIDARNNGTGELSITSTGDVTSAASDGIYATNYAASTDLTISAHNVTGYGDGINAFSSGSGAVSITTTGQVTGTGSMGISAENFGTDMTINAHDVTGANRAINATHHGSGALSITTTGHVSTPSRSALAAYVSGNGTNLTIAANTVSGGARGVDARNFGGGALSITTTGDVTARSRAISAYNLGTDLTIEAADVTSDYRGIIAYNYGSGELSITSTGTVTGTDADGISATNTGTDLTVAAAGVSGGYRGIFALNNGSGALSITATEAVIGETDHGIEALNVGMGLTLNTASVSGGESGIHAQSVGTGAVNITATETVTGAASDGIFAYNSSYGGTDLTINAASVNGGGNGIRAVNHGTGALSVTATGDVSGDADGINAFNFFGTDLIISAAAVTGSTGISVRNDGSGELSVTATGAVRGTGQGGIYAGNFTTSATVLTVSATDVTGATFGIAAFNNGTGALSVTTTGDVAGASSDGIQAINNGTNLSVEAVGATGTEFGINATNYGSGTTNVTVSGVVSGGAQAGIQVSAVAASSATITFDAGADVSSDSGVALINNESDSLSTFNSGSRVTGEVQLADGSDSLVLAGGDASGVTLFDGGDDSSVSDGFIDIVQVTGQGYDLAGASFTNWEAFSVEGGSVAFNDTALSIGDNTTGTGVNVEQGGMFATGADFTLNALLHTDTGGIFNASGAGSGSVTLNGDVNNDGMLTSQDGVAGDVMTIAGNFTGSGVVGLDTDLGGDGSNSDLLVVQGDASGASILSIANSNGGGNVTSLGIEVISVEGNSSENFTLAGDFETAEGEQAIVGGSYLYTLSQGDSGNWLLRSTDDTGSPRYQPGAPIYDSYALSLLALNGTSSLRNRGTSLEYRQQASAANASPVQRLSTSSQKTPSPFWIQMGFDDITTARENSVTGASSDSSVWELQAGADAILNEGETGFLVGGLILNYATSDTRVASQSGSGSIDTTGMGLTMAATWYDYGGFYVDGQLKFSRYDSDLSSSILGALSQGNNGSGQALSIEVGQEYQIESGLTLIPQAQLTQSSIDFDSFTGTNGERVSLDTGDSLLLRIGLEVDQYKSLEKGEQRLYGIANIFHEFKGGTAVDISGVPLSNSGDDWAGEIGLGGNYSWDDDYSVYGEVSYTTGLQNFGDSQKVSANIGFKMEF